MNFTNKFAEIVANDPDAQARAVNTVVSFISGKTLIKIICGYVLEFACSWVLYESQNIIRIGLGKMPLLKQLLFN